MYQRVIYQACRNRRSRRAPFAPHLLVGLTVLLGVQIAHGQETKQVIDTPLRPIIPAKPILIDDVRSSDPRISQTESRIDPQIAKWEDDVQALEELDATAPSVDDAILFVGSSSIRLWSNIDRDMAPYRTIRRGYGGAKYSDVAHYARRLITPHNYRALVLFVGNDVAGKTTDHTPEQVETWMNSILDVARSHRPDAPVLIIEVTPTPSRFGSWSALRHLNAKLRDIALTKPNTYFIATAEMYLDRDGQPLEDLFLDDRLHQNDKGYALWSSLIRRRLDEVFRQLATQP